MVHKCTQDIMWEADVERYYTYTHIICENERKVNQ